MTGKLTVNTATGHLTGPAAIKYNTPWPCRNGNYGSGAMSGLLMHTMVGNLQPGTVAWFNDSAAQASAHFGVSQAGEIWQFGPIGKSWCAWHAAEANLTWYGCEFADAGNPANPLTSEQITAGAQILECLSAFAGFPLQISNSPSVKGLGWHGMGGEAFGGHPNCPGDTRKAQRPQIIALATSIRQGAILPPAQDWTQIMIANLPTLKQGTADKSGEAQMVHRMQALVKVIGDINKLPAASAVSASGAFDATTMRGVLAVQKMFGLTQDAVVGPATWAALVAAQRG